MVVAAGFAIWPRFSEEAMALPKRDILIEPSRTPRESIRRREAEPVGALGSSSSRAPLTMAGNGGLPVAEFPTLMQIHPRALAPFSGSRLNSGFL